jgi:hypothetical protein
VGEGGLRRRAGAGLGRTFSQASFRDYLSTIGLRMAQVVNWMIFSWLGLMAAGVTLPLRAIFTLGPLIGLAAVIPTPGRLGTSQAAWVLCFQHLAPAEALFAFSLLWTLSVNLLRWIIGSLFFAGSPAREKP